MSIVLAVIDSSAAARPVLETAAELGRLTGHAVSAIHVRQDGTDTAELLTERAGIPLRILDAPVHEALLDAVADPDVALAVIGARATLFGRRPAGRTALHVLEYSRKPIVVVPPEAVSPASFRRLLVPLEGTPASSQPVLDCLTDLLGADVDVVALHVFTHETLPRMMDRPVRDLEIIGAEFLARHLPGAARRVEFRTGPVDTRVAEVCAEEGADLIVLSWSQDAGAGRAAVIRGVLSDSKVPVLLVPVGAGAEAASPCDIPPDQRRAMGPLALAERIGT